MSVWLHQAFWRKNDSIHRHYQEKKECRTRKTSASKVNWPRVCSVHAYGFWLPGLFVHYVWVTFWHIISRVERETVTRNGSNAVLPVQWVCPLDGAPKSGMGMGSKWWIAQMENAVDRYINAVEGCLLRVFPANNISLPLPAFLTFFAPKNYDAALVGIFRRIYFWHVIVTAKPVRCLCLALLACTAKEGLVVTHFQFWKNRHSQCKAAPVCESRARANRMKRWTVHSNSLQYIIQLALGYSRWFMHFFDAVYI